MRYSTGIRATAAAATAALLLGVGSGASEASTITCDFVSGNTSNTTTYSLVVSGAAACGLVGNDDASALGSISGVFEAPPAWTLAFKTDDAAGDGSLTLTGLNPTDTTGGTWSISGFPELTQIAIVLKAGNNFAAFLLTPFITEGTWTSDRGISHASVYYRSCEAGDPGCGVNVIPLPAAGWLLLSGLGALGVAGYRRRRQAA